MTDRHGRRARNRRHKRRTINGLSHRIINGLSLEVGALNARNLCLQDGMRRLAEDLRGEVVVLRRENMGPWVKPDYGDRFFEVERHQWEARKFECRLFGGILRAEPVGERRALYIDIDKMVLRAKDAAEVKQSQFRSAARAIGEEMFAPVGAKP